MAFPGRHATDATPYLLAVVKALDGRGSQVMDDCDHGGGLVDPVLDLMSNRSRKGEVLGNTEMPCVKAPCVMAPYVMARLLLTNVPCETNSAGFQSRGRLYYLF